MRPRSLHAATSVLLDLDGVLYVEDEPIPGAIEAVSALRDHGLRLRFVTNTTSRPRREILARLERLGMPLPEDELVTPARLAVEHCLAAARRSGHEAGGPGGRRTSSGCPAGRRARRSPTGDSSEHDSITEIRISDDGHGFDPETSTDGFGLIGMRERIALQDGAITITSDPGHGTTVRAELPVHRRWPEEGADTVRAVSG